MKFFTALLSALALAASTTTATNIAERSDEDAGIAVIFTAPKLGDTWEQDLHEDVTWLTSALPVNTTDKICLSVVGGNSSNPVNSSELLPLSHPSLRFTVVVT